MISLFRKTQPRLSKRQTRFFRYWRLSNSVSVLKKSHRDDILFVLSAIDRHAYMQRI